MTSNAMHNTESSRLAACSGPLVLLDLSQRVSHVVLATDDRVLPCAFESLSDASREVLWDVVRTSMRDAALKPHDIRGIAVATGPGGFTGLRVAIAFAKAAGYALQIPVVGIPSALIFAASDRVRVEGRGEGRGCGPWLVALASKAGTAWCAMIHEQSDRSLAMADASVVDSGGFRARATEVHAAGGVLLTDDHLDTTLAEVAGQVGLARRAIATDATAFIALVRERILSGTVENLYEIEPIYAREPEAVTKWRALHGTTTHGGPSRAS